ncbi:hypothetical protein OAQ34_10560, partial [Opitutales bacterium]|nr:hypothetical protein [Opitutales bacterium]
RSLSFPPRNDKVVLTTSPFQSCHREGVARGDSLGPVSEETNPSASLKPRWIAAPVTFVPSSQ